MPASSNFRNFLSAVTMPKPLFSQAKAHSRECASASAAAFFEQDTSTTETSLKDSVAAKAGAAIKPSARKEASIFIVILHFVVTVLNFWVLGKL